MARYFLWSALIHLFVFLLIFFSGFSLQNDWLLNSFVRGKSAVEISFGSGEFSAEEDVWQNKASGSANKNISQNKDNTSYEKAGIDTLRWLAGDNEPPRYPLLALKNNWSGEVVLRLFINNSGQLDDVRVVSSSGYPLLDKAALNAALNWRFSGGPKNVQIDYPVRFVLK